MKFYREFLKVFCVIVVTVCGLKKCQGSVLINPIDHCRNENFLTICQLSIVDDLDFLEFDTNAIWSSLNLRIFVSVPSSPRIPKKLFATFSELTNLTVSNIKYISQEEFSDGQNLQKLNIMNSNVSNIGEDVFVFLHNLEELSITNSQVETLNSDAFSGLRKLLKLNFKQNRLRELPFDIFKPLPNLQHVDFEDNQISILHNELFQHTYKVTFINFRRNQIKTIGLETFIYLSLNTLDLSENEFPVLQTASVRDLLARNGKLRRCYIFGTVNYIFVPYNELTELYISDLDLLEWVTLHDNLLPNIRNLTNASNLISLDISRNPIEELLPSDLAEMNSLKYIDLDELKYPNVVIGSHQYGDEFQGLVTININVSPSEDSSAAYYCAFLRELVKEFRIRGSINVFTELHSKYQC